MKKFLTGSFVLLVFIGILYLGNLAVYQGVTLALHLQNSDQLFYFALTLAVLTGSFVVATILGNFFYNAFTRAYYLLSAIWIGFFTYAVLASLLFLALVAVSPSLAWTGPFLYAVAIFLSLYGLIHAQQIIIKTVPLTLPNLPSSWKGRKALWISDVHFGQLHGSTLAENIVKHIERLAPDIIFVGGDLFDGTGAPNLEEQTAPFKRVSAPLGMYFITGNHEEYGDLKRFLATVESVGMRVLKDELVEIDGLQLIGVDYPSTTTEASFTKVMSTFPIDRTRPSILLMHVPERLATSHKAGISLQISGHTHDAQMWPLNHVGQMIHQGFAYGLKSFKEMQVYTSSGTGTWGPPMRVGTDSEMVLFVFD